MGAPVKCGCTACPLYTAAVVQYALLRACFATCRYCAVGCRQRLSNDSFSVFLQAIKELNSGKKTREETLHTANNIFGASNGDLFGKRLIFCVCCWPICGVVPNIKC